MSFVSVLYEEVASVVPDIEVVGGQVICGRGASKIVIGNLNGDRVVCEKEIAIRLATEYHVNNKSFSRSKKNRLPDDTSQTSADDGSEVDEVDLG